MEVTPQQGSQSGREHIQVHGLDHIIVRARVQAFDDGLGFVQRGEDKDGQFQALLANPAAQVQAVTVWQPQVQNERVVGANGKGVPGFFRGAHGFDRVPLEVQALHQGPRQGRVVFHEQ